MNKASIFCFPFAGGSASSFNCWKRLPAPFVDIVPLEYSGHGWRMKERLYCSVNEAAEDMAKTIIASNCDNYLLLGYSYGSLVALETAYLLRDFQHSPRALIVAAQRPPHLLRKDKLFNLNDERKLMDAVISLGHIPEEILACPEFINLYSEIICADIIATQRHIHNSTLGRLDIPVYAFRGVDDEETPREDMEQYKYYTESLCKVLDIEGDHFFAFDKNEEFLETLGVVLSELC